MKPHVPFEIRPSPIQGLGAFATQHIRRGTTLIEYAGERLTPEEADARYPDNDSERHHTFLFAIDDDVVIDAAVDGNDARFINHSCDPNCDAVIEDGRIWIETIRDIEPGEELAYDYAYELEERHTPKAKRRFPCNCGARNCRGTLLVKKRARKPRQNSPVLPAVRSREPERRETPALRRAASTDCTPSRSSRRRTPR